MKAARDKITNIDAEELPSIKLFYDDILIEEGNNSICNEIFDGIQLKVELAMISVFVIISSTYRITIQISLVSYLCGSISTNAVLCNCN